MVLSERQGTVLFNQKIYWFIQPINWWKHRSPVHIVKNTCIFQQHQDYMKIAIQGQSSNFQTVLQEKMAQVSPKHLPTEEATYRVSTRTIHSSDLIFFRSASPIQALMKNSALNETFNNARCSETAKLPSLRGGGLLHICMSHCLGPAALQPCAEQSHA